MSIDLRDSVDKWKSHFQAMARGKIPLENVYMLNQKGRGLGTNPKGRALYKVQTGGQSTTSSPANKGYAMALGRIRNTQKKKKVVRRRATVKGIKRRTNKGGIRKVTKHRRGRTTTKRKTRKSTSKRKTSTKKRKSTKSKTVKRKVKDVFK